MQFLKKIKYKIDTKRGIISNNNIEKFQTHKNIIDEFEENFDNVFSDNKKKTYLKNKKDLIIINLPFNHKSNIENKRDGRYDSKDNKIFLYGDNNIKDELIHQLLLVAGRKSRVYQGFTYNQKEKYHDDSLYSIGYGLTEGYAELLKHKYFDKNNGINNYSELEIIASGIEKVVGEPFMEGIYFNGSLTGLVKIMSRYCESTDKCCDIISEIDDFYNTKNLNIKKKKYNKIIDEIATINQNKLNYDYVNDYLNHNEYQRKCFTDVNLYRNNKFIYKKICMIVDMEDSIVTIGDFGKTTIKKDKIELQFTPDFEYNKDRKIMKIGGKKWTDTTN